MFCSYLHACSLRSNASLHQTVHRGLFMDCGELLACNVPVMHTLVMHVLQANSNELRGSHLL